MMARILTVCVIALGFASYASAQQLTGTLKRVAETGEFRIGYVPDAPPMSFDDGSDAPVGYSISLCRNIANAVKSATGREELKISYVPLISPDDRINGVVNGIVDIECGATTVTLSRREKVDFTLMTFITGGAVLSRNGNAINSILDLSEKTVAVITGTTTHSALRKFINGNDMKITLRMIATHEEGMDLLNAEKVDGYASDRAMLVGQVFRTADRSKYAITRDVFSFEPYALMLKRGDTDFRLVADRALASLYGNARIRRLYHDWFGRYGEPMTPVLEALYEFQAVGE
jgi:glutamate/aspartate transport system substrate-binding protein